MPNYILRMEGIDFDATISDTHNLSAYRGGSRALLAAARAVGKLLQDARRNAGVKYGSEILAAASLGAWVIEAANDAAADAARTAVEAYLRDTGYDAKSGDAPFAHLSFAVDIAAGDDLKALKQAEANNHARQLCHANWALPAFVKNGRSAPGDLDRVRPSPGDLKVQKTLQAVSPSFEARFLYGYRQKRRFYADMAGVAADGLTFADNFEEIIKDAPNGLPPSVSGKIAVFYADGNSFGKIRDANRLLADYGAFSTYVQTESKILVGRILDWLRDGANGKDKCAFVYPADEEDGLALRFETLLWGGDELTFVMPAWLGIEFAQQFCEWTRTWKAPKIDDKPAVSLTFGMGLIFCHEKTPIRQARAMAKAIADDGKDLLKDPPYKDSPPQNVLQVEAFESIALPEHGLGGYRASLFALPYFPDEKKHERDEQERALRSLLTLHGVGIGDTLAAIGALKTSDFPRSQIYKLLRIAKDKGLFKQLGPDDRELEPGDDRNPVIKAARVYLKRMSKNRKTDFDALHVLGKFPAGAPHAERDKPLAWSLAAASALWDYVNPLDGLDHADAAPDAAALAKDAA